MRVYVLDHVKNATTPNDDALVRVPGHHGAVYLTTVGELRAATHIKLRGGTIINLRGAEICNGNPKNVPIRELRVGACNYIDHLPRGSIFITPRQQLR